MQLLLKRDDHIEEEDYGYGYGCICSKCGSGFIFDRKDVCMSKCINPKLKGYVLCPNCQNFIHSDEYQ